MIREMKSYFGKKISELVLAKVGDLEGKGALLPVATAEAKNHGIKLEEVLYDDTALKESIVKVIDDLKEEIVTRVKENLNLETLINMKQDTLIPGANIAIKNNVISSTDTVYDDDAVRELITKEAINRGSADADLQQRVDALQGALIYIGTINLATSEVTQEELNARAQELGRYSLAKGYVLVDTNANDWWYDGTTWINIGWYEVAQATNESLGVVRGSAGDMKVSVDGNGEMSVNGLDISAFMLRKPYKSDTNSISETVNGVVTVPSDAEAGSLYIDCNLRLGVVTGESGGLKTIRTLSVPGEDGGKKYLPNTTGNPESTGVTDGASLSMRQGGSLDFTEGSRLEMRQGASIKLASNALLRSVGNSGAIFGLQGRQIAEAETGLTSEHRIFFVTGLVDLSASVGSCYFETWSVGDVFYFIAKSKNNGKDKSIRLLISPASDGNHLIKTYVLECETAMSFILIGWNGFSPIFRHIVGNTQRIEEAIGILQGGLDWLQGQLYSKLDANSTITPATKTKITYDPKGLVTAGSDLVDSDIPSLAASKITSGAFANDRIPNLDASKITSGAFANDRIPNLDASKITSGAIGTWSAISVGFSYVSSNSTVMKVNTALRLVEITLFFTANATASSATVFTLPAPYRPREQRTLLCPIFVSGVTSLAGFTLGTDGTFKGPIIAGYTYGGFFCFSY